MENNVLISAKGLKKYFPVSSFLGGKKKYIRAVDDIDLDIYKGETFGLVGESGCGKSTLGKTLIRCMSLLPARYIIREKISLTGS